MTKNTRMPKLWGVLLVPGLLLAGAGWAAPTAQTAVISRVTASPAHVRNGGTAALSVALADRSLSASNVVVDLEVYNAKGTRVAQNIWQGQKLVKGKSSAYHWAWKPKTPGAYTVKVGVFGAGWKPLYQWNDKALTMTVS